ncbi:hypothetical protein ABEI56_05035 [Peribacillus castrilensis]|uniref:hypothetical protein n=1 Tax=Peribacillus TaxID=2675229 RepID=UPI00387221C2
MKKFIADGEDIVTTHYIDTLKDTGLIRIDETTSQVNWTGKADYDVRYNNVKHHALAENLYEVDCNTAL